MPSVDTTPLIAAVDQLADRLRALPQSTLRRGAAQEGLALARSLSKRAQRLEFGAAMEPRTMPDAGVFAVGDQVSVAGHDMAQALAEDPDSAPAALEWALREVRSAAARVG
ncbi:hypothetical protein [Streptomyces axinellae]|uniref:Uncharacterized protein n=1 Tax=Streptomyces axinellae TaxID=552788 RepID=A0ABN3Q6Y2_9ACTN